MENLMVELTKNEKVQGKTNLYNIEGYIDGQFFYATFNKSLNEIIGSSIYGEEWSEKYYKINECFTYWLHVEVIKTIN